MARVGENLTKTDFVNVALSKLGSDRVQMADYESDNTEIKEIVKLYFESAGEEILNVTDWNFAKFTEKIATTGSSSSKPYNRVADIAGSGRGTTYDAYRVIEVQPQFGDDYATFNSQKASSKINWIEVKDNIYADLNPDGATATTNLIVTYITNPIQELDGASYPNGSEFFFFDSLFLKCWYTNLASKLAVPLTGSKDLEKAIKDELINICIPEAKRVNAVEGSQIVGIGADFNEIGSINNYKNFGKV